MSNENIPKDYDFKKKRFGSKNGKMRSFINSSVMELNLDI